MSWSTIDIGCASAGRRGAFAAMLVIVLGAAAAPLLAKLPEDKAMTATESDPVKLGWMVGSPPPPDKIIRFTDGDYFSFPKLRWTVCHFRQLMPTVGVSRGAGASVPLERKIDDSIDAVTFTPLGSEKAMTWAESLQANYTDVSS